MAKLFSAAELEELRRADAEIEEHFAITQEDIARSRAMDREAKLDRLDNHSKRIAAQQAAYYEANREKIAAQQAAYREANREKIAAQRAAYREANREKIAAQQAAYYEANREKYNAYMREYMRKLRAEKKKAASGGRNTEDGKQNCPWPL